MPGPVLKLPLSNSPHPPPPIHDAGNPQFLGQKPITFFRQVLSLVEYPEVS
jgi:hypothetical protein